MNERRITLKEFNEMTLKELVEKARGFSTSLSSLEVLTREELKGEAIQRITDNELNDAHSIIAYLEDNYGLYYVSDGHGMPRKVTKKIDLIDVFDIVPLSEECEQKVNDEIVLVEEDYKGYYKRYALTTEEFKERFSETVEKMGEPTEESCSDTIKPLVHIWYQKEKLNSWFWVRFFTDMAYGLPDSDVESGNLAYIDIEECSSLKEAVMPFYTNLSKKGE